VLENVVLDESMRRAAWGMSGHSTLATAIFYPARREHLQVAQELAAGHCDAMTVACTLVDEVLVCRGLAHRADRLRGVLIHLWSALRPRMLGLDATAPRIWAT
jgi:urease accessory protein